MGKRLFCIVSMLSIMTACGHYRRTSEGYRTSSDYRTPASQNLPQQTYSYFPKRPLQLTWPVRNVRMTRGFRPTSDPRHEGVDLGGKRETPIYAAHEGVVIYTGRDFRGYGNMVLVEYNNEWATLYAHLNSISVRVGQNLEAGDPLGGMGRTGRASGVHLHFELLHKRKPVDPLSFLTQTTRFAELK